MSTPFLGIKELFANQTNASNYAIHNEAIRDLEAICVGAVKSRSLTAPPNNPVEGDLYIPASGATGDWVGLENKVVQWRNGIWESFTPFEWMHVVSIPDGGWIYWDGTNWQGGSGGGAGLTEEAVDDRVAALLQSGSNVNLNYDDTNNTLTITANDQTFTLTGIEIRNLLSGLDPSEFLNISAIGGIDLSEFLDKANYTINNLIKSTKLLSYESRYVSQSEITGGVYTLLTTDLGKELIFTGTVNIKIPDAGGNTEFGHGWHCLVALDGAGALLFSSLNSATLIPSGGSDRLALTSQGTISLRVRSNGVWKLEGALSVGGGGY